MTDQPEAPGAESLPVVAWQGEEFAHSFISEAARVGNGEARWLKQYSIALTPHEPAQAQLDALREEVARLTKERDEARDITFNVIEHALAVAGVKPSLGMALAAAQAMELYDAAREALRAKLAARKEEL